MTLTPKAVRSRVRRYLKARYPNEKIDVLTCEDSESNTVYVYTTSDTVNNCPEFKQYVSYKCDTCREDPFYFEFKNLKFITSDEITIAKVMYDWGDICYGYKRMIVETRIPLYILKLNMKIMRVKDLIDYGTLVCEDEGGYRGKGYWLKDNFYSTTNNPLINIVKDMGVING